MKDIGLTHIALPVTDLTKSYEFYSKYAGMENVHERPGVLWISDKSRPFVIVLIEFEKVQNPLLPEAHIGVATNSVGVGIGVGISLGTALAKGTFR